MFPKWTNKVRLILAGLVVVVPLYVFLVGTYAASPQATAVGYAPVQPVPYSHAMHVGQLGIDCRYCHTTVESAPHAAIPPTQTCINCHSQQNGVRVKTPTNTPNPNLQLVEARYYGTENEPAGLPIPWVRVHDLPGFVYFNHSAHVNKGVGCAECHGRVDEMAAVEQVAPLNMGWCLDCHRDPYPRLRPLEEITNLAWTYQGDRAQLGRELAKKYDVKPRTSCYTCHR